MLYELGAKLSIHPTYIQRLTNLSKLDTHGKISCIKELEIGDAKQVFLNRNYCRLLRMHPGLSK